MKFQNFTTLAFGIYSFFGLYVTSISADDSVRQSESINKPINKVQQFHPRRPSTRVNVNVGGDDHSIIAASDVASPEEEHPRVLMKRAVGPWTADEERLLLELRDRDGLTWDEIREFYPERSSASLQVKYRSLTRRPDRDSKNPGPWTEEDTALLIELREAGVPWEDIARRFPGRSWKSLRERYMSSTRDRRVESGASRQWTREEIELLMRLEEEGVPWEERAAFFNGRSLTSLRMKLMAIRRSGPPFTSEEDD